MRKFIVALVFLLGVLFLISQFTEVEAVVDTLQRGDWRFLALALVVQVFWMFNMGATFQAIYHILGLNGSNAHMLRLATAAGFVNVIAPSGGVGGIAIFLADAKRRNYSSARAMVAGALFALFDHAGFLCVLTLGLVVLIRRNNLDLAEIIASLVILGIAVVLAVLLYLSMRSAHSLGRALSWMVRLVNRIAWPFTHRKYLSEERAVSFAIEAADGIKSVRENPRSLIYPLLLSLVNKLLMVAVMWLVFLAFQVNHTVGTVIAGFCIAHLFRIVTPTPSGIGIVEGILTLSLTTLYVPLGAATVVALAYRGFTFWVPLLIGMVAFRSLAGTEKPQQSGI